MEFEKLVAQHKDAVYRQMVRLCGNQTDAEDALAEALLKAFRAQNQLSDEAAFRGWLAIIARRTCGRMKRRENMADIVSLAELADKGQEPAADMALPEEQALEADTKRCILSVIAEMPPLYRSVYTLSELDELPAREVAEQLGITVAAVKSRLHRARTLLRAGIDQQLCGEGERR